MNDRKRVAPDIEYELLGAWEVRRYASLAPAVDLTYLIATAPTQVAMGADINGVPVGLALAGAVSQVGARVTWIQVADGRRRQGVGSRLLARLEGELAQRGFTILDALVRAPSPPDGSVSFLERAGWQRGNNLATVLVFSRRIAQAPWLRMPVRDSPDYELFPWAEVTAGDRDTVEDWRLIDPIASVLTPWAEPEPFHAATSFGLRHRGSLAGWCVTHRVRPDTLRYSSVYVAPEHRRTAALPLLLGTSIRRHLSMAGELPRGIQANPAGWGEIARFARKRLAPWADQVCDVAVFWKELTNGPRSFSDP